MTVVTPTDPSRSYGGDKIFTRAFRPLLEVRSVAKGGDGRIIEGITVPYLREQRIDPSLVEQFAPGAFDHQLRAVSRVQFSYGHIGPGQTGELIGRALEMRNDAAGLWGAFRVAATRTGDDVLALVAENALSDFSIAFRERENFREPNGTITRVRADLRHVAIVLEGAYGDGAQVMAMRSSDQQGQTAWRPEPRRIDQVDALIAGMGALPALPE
jgi:HK97 family phage prohead protease